MECPGHGGAKSAGGSTQASCSNFSVFYSDVMTLGPMPDSVANASSRPTMAIMMLFPNPSLANIHCHLQIRHKTPSHVPCPPFSSFPDSLLSEGLKPCHAVLASPA